ncbi:MAG TPA: potassium channel family protein [Kineosporiaceae bacterium]|nr:potassium channel family protein [Kineosporiaceae bacterium]
MTLPIGNPPPPAERRRMVTVGLARALVIVTGLTVGYYLTPLDVMTAVPLWLSLTAGVLTLVAVTASQVRAIIRAPHPAARAVLAVAIIVPLFVLLFAAAYFLLSQADASNFNQQSLNRTDTLYFTMTVFATVGFGDITAVSQTARVVVTIQMILDLIVLGALIRVLLGAVHLGRQRPDHRANEPS